MRPVANDDTAYFVIDGGDDLGALLDLSADYFQFLRAEGLTVQKFDWHVSQTAHQPPRSVLRSILIADEHSRARDEGQGITR